METFNFQNDAPILKYCQKSLNSCCLGNLSSAFDSINETKSDNFIVIRIEKSLKIQVGNRIGFANAILKNEKRVKGEQKMYYNLVKYKKKGYYDILKGISGHVTLVKLMGLLGNMNHSIRVVGYWIFDSNYKRSLVLNR